MDINGLSKNMEESVSWDQAGGHSSQVQLLSDNKERISQLLSYLGSSSMSHSPGEDRFKAPQESHYPALSDYPSSFTNGNVQLANGIGKEERGDQKARKGRPVDSYLKQTIGQTRIQKNERQGRQGQLGARSGHTNGQYRASLHPNLKSLQEAGAVPEICSEKRRKLVIGQVQVSPENSQARKAFPETSTHIAPLATPVLSNSSYDLAESELSNDTIGYNSFSAFSRGLLDQITPSNGEHTGEERLNQPLAEVPHSQQVSSNYGVIEPEEPAVMLQYANPRATGSNQSASHILRHQALSIPPSIAEHRTSSTEAAHHANQIQNTARHHWVSHIPLNADFPHATRDNPYEFQSFRHRSYGNSTDYNEYREANNDHDGMSMMCFTKWLDERSKDLYQQR